MVAPALDAPDRMIIDKKVGDVRYLSIEGFEHMKVDRYLLDSTVPGDTTRERFINVYRKHAVNAFEKKLSGLSSLEDETKVDEYWYYFLDNMEGYILTRGRITRLLSTALWFRSPMHEYGISP